ncbi:MAG: glycosyltransferase family 2 protein [Bacteroidota bacterium]|nr:glycosyltransferase family 2 protein [Bacteroidota bacterium]
MDISNIVTAVIINYQTPDLIRHAIASFRKFYPNVQLILIDNGSRDESVKILTDIQSTQSATTKLVLNKTNIHHGPAMHQAINLCSSDLVLFLDSDCEVLGGGFIEAMIELIEQDKQHYAVGKTEFLNERGFLVKPNQKSIRYIRPICMLVRKTLYNALPPFQLHGAPCLANMKEAAERNFGLIEFDIHKFIFHKGRGTASKFGYGLGIRGKVNYLLNKLNL